MNTPRRILGISDSKSVFVDAHKQPLLLQLARDQTSTPSGTTPCICYIGAATGDRPDRIASFFNLAQRAGFRPTSLDLFAMKTGNPQAYFANADVVFIDGGVTRNLLALFREWNVVDALIEAYQQGALIVGASAGISMLFEWCVSDSIKSDIQPVKGIQLLKGSFCAHYDALESRRNTLAELVRSEPSALPAYGLEDGVAILFENEQLVETFAVRRNAKLHLFQPSDGGISHSQSIGRRLNAMSLPGLGH